MSGANASWGTYRHRIAIVLEGDKLIRLQLHQISQQL